MRLIALVVTVLALGAVGVSAASARSATTSSPPSREPVLVAFGGHSFGGGLFRRSRYYGGYGRYGRHGRYGRYGYRHPFLHHVARALVWAYILHLFFSSGAASLLLWIILIALVAHLFSRGRRRRYGRGY